MTNSASTSDLGRGALARELDAAILSFQGIAEVIETVADRLAQVEQTERRKSTARTSAAA